MCEEACLGGADASDGAVRELKLDDAGGHKLLDTWYLDEHVGEMLIAIRRVADVGHPLLESQTVLGQSLDGRKHQVDHVGVFAGLHQL